MRQSIAFRSRALLALAGCSHHPDLHRPASDQHPCAPRWPKLRRPTNGAIYQAATYRPLFEDRRARHVGDMLTIDINEKTAAGKAGASSEQQDRFGQLAVAGMPLQGRFGASRGRQRSNKFPTATTRAPATPSPAPSPSP